MNLFLLHATPHVMTHHIHAHTQASTPWRCTKMDWHGQYFKTEATSSQYFVPKPLTLTIWMSDESKNSPGITGLLNLKVKDISHSTGAVLELWAVDIKHGLQLISCNIHITAFVNTFFLQIYCAEINFLGYLLLHPPNVLLFRGTESLN